MEPRVSHDSAVQFRTPESSLGDLDAGFAADLIATAADIALVVNPDGTIHDVALGPECSSLESAKSWIGRPWIETVTVESRAKVERLIHEAQESAPPRWREVNHISAGDESFLVRYAVLQAGQNGRIVAIGRDQRVLTDAQQRLIDYQQSMEREYARLRHAETRYRLLFQISSEAVLIVDAGSGSIIDANPAAAKLLGSGEKRIAGKAFLDLFKPKSRQAAETLVATVRAVGKAERTEATLASTSQPISISATLFRQDKTVHILVRLAPLVGPLDQKQPPEAETRVARVMENLPDGFVVTDLGRKILSANAAFLEMAQLVGDEQAIGQPLERWLGRPGVDSQVLVKSLREQGSVSDYATVIHSELGTTDDVMVSAVSVENGEEPCIGFVIRSIGKRVATSFRPSEELPQSVEQLTELVGRVPLKDLVRDTTDIIERLCVEAALKLTGDNRASAAQMLGLSRQSLYAKLRRYGIGEETEAG
ncbi:transcriptional regulator PpsR [Algihabitans albus]|uniref:transcriptional regulator PpsR n=1 Tax=Algihabitans albus TaxID=2164067 RepID=UPI000E5CD1E5|nr:transcriptional regulator PpsR [Algihabitans albus]